MTVTTVVTVVVSTERRSDGMHPKQWLPVLVVTLSDTVLEENKKKKSGFTISFNG